MALVPAGGMAPEDAAAAARLNQQTLIEEAKEFGFVFPSQQDPWAVELTLTDTTSTQAPMYLTDTVIDFGIRQTY